MRALFVKCPDGHLFRNRSCPYDGWTHRLMPLEEELFANRPESQIKDFLDAGISDDLASRLVIVEAMSIPGDLEGIDVKSCVKGGSETKRG